MKKKFLLIGIILASFLLRTYQIGIFPMMKTPQDLILRYISLGAGVVSTVFIYIYTRKLNVKTALLTSFIYSILPWTIEQGRIFSQVNIVTALLILLLILFDKVSSKTKKAFLFILYIILFLLIYSDVWFLKMKEINIGYGQILKNILLLLNPDTLFFSNITFWWGGVKDWGMMHAALIPFFISGIYVLAVNNMKYLLFPMICIFLLSVSSPYLPESREFFMMTPFFSIILGIGINYWSKQKLFWQKTVFIFLMLFLVYDFSQYLHFYMVHYVQYVRENISKIYVSF